MPSMIATNCNFIIFAAALAILIAKAFASPPDLQNLDTLAHGWILQSNSDSSISSKEFNDVMFPSLIAFITAPIYVSIVYNQEILPHVTHHI